MKLKSGVVRLKSLDVYIFWIPYCKPHGNAYPVGRMCTQCCPQQFSFIPWKHLVFCESLEEPQARVSHGSVRMQMEVVTFHAGFLSHVDIEITLQGHQLSKKKKCECCHWGLLVTKLVACVRKKYLKGLVVLSAQKNPEETFFFRLEKVFQGKLSWCSWKVRQCPRLLCPSACWRRCQPQRLSRASMGISGRGTWQELSLLEKPPCLSTWEQGWRQCKPGLFFLFKAFAIPITHSPRHAIQDLAVPLFLQLLHGDIIMLLSQMLRGLINYVYETLWDSQMKGGFGIVRCYYKKKRMILLLYVNG